MTTPRGKLELTWVGKPWHYRLISEDAVQPTPALTFILGHAVRVPVE